MNIHGGGGCSSSSSIRDFNIILVFGLYFSLLSDVHTLNIEWSLVSPHQLAQSRNTWFTPQGGDTANIDFSKGGQIAFVPAPMARYGLYNRAYPTPKINLCMSKPKHSSESSSEEHRRKKKRHHRHSSEEGREYEPEHHHDNHHEHQPEHHEHHKSAKEELNDEHAEQAEISAGIASQMSKMSEFMKAQLAKHIEMRDEEMNRGNVEAAKKEQVIIDLYQDQIKYLEGIEKAQEAIMAGEVEMYYDHDGAGQKHGHHGHHGDGGHHEGHGNHHHGGDHHHHHDADEPEHHHHDHDADDDDEGHGHEHHGGDDDDDEGHGHAHHGGDDDDDEGEDEDEGRGHDGHGGDDDDEDDHEGHGHDHEGHEHHGGHDDEGHGEGHHGNDDEDEFHDVGDKFENDDDTKNDPDYHPDDKHKLDKRSPFVSSFLPSLSSPDTTPPVKTPDTTTSDTVVQADASANAAANTAEAKAEAGVTSTTTSPSPDPSTTDVSTTANAAAQATTTGSDASATATATASSSTSDSNSGWLSWFGSSNTTPTYSPYTLLRYLSPTDKSADNLMSMFNVFSDPSNSSYLSNASTLMRIVMFFMPGTGIVDQVYFTMALSKIMWEAATMYYDGYGTVEIAVVILGEMAEASYLSRRGEDSIISQKILTPGETIKIDGMDVPAFLKYVKNMKYPDLAEAQEEKLQKDIDNLINITYPNISPELKTTFVGGLKDTMKFLSLFNVEGNLRVENVDVNFSDVYIKMHSAFDDSPLEKIKKSILGAIDAIKSNFN